MRIDNDFPESARIGLIHIVQKLVDTGYVEGWMSVTRELRRIARYKREKGGNADDILYGLPWQNVCDFCERLYSHLTQDVMGNNGYVEVARSTVQAHIADDLNLLFAEENLAFEFSGGFVRRRGRRNTVEKVERAQNVLGDPKLSKVTRPSFCTTASERVYITASGCEIEFGGTRGL